MAIGRNIEESLLKAVRSLEIGAYHNELAELSHVSDLELTKKMVHAQDDRLFYLSEAIRRGYSIEELQSLTKIDLFFLDKLLHIIEIETALESHVDNVAVLKEAKQNGFLIGKSQHFGDKQNKPSLTSAEPIKLCPSIKWWIRAAEFESHTPYFYSTYEVENESNEKPSVLVLGSGPIRIGQGVEFDYATVHSVKAIQAAGYEAIIMNSNPETVSTDFCF